MKLSKNITLLFTCSAALLGATAACGSDDEQPIGDGDGDSNPGDGDGDTGPGGTSGLNPSDLYQGPQCAKPGGASCTGTASGIACPDGSTNAVEFTCAQGDICADGACVGQCEAGATECVGNSASRICTADGKSWVNVACQAGEICEDGMCGSEDKRVCVPGAQDCGPGGSARTCKEDGSGWDEEDCPGDTTCNDGMCEGTVCTVGATRCESSTHDFPALFRDQYLFESGGGEPAFDTIYRCVDGERWVAEPCPSEDDAQTACTYEGLNAAEVARYQGEVRSWMMEFYIAANTSEGQADALSNLKTTPVTPSIPPSAKAVCAPVDEYCGFEGEGLISQFFESPSQSRECGEWSEEEQDDRWTSFTQCEGMLPYAPRVARNYECSGLTACGLDSPESGCVPVECLPEESICDNEADFSVCDFDEDYPRDSEFDSYDSCPSESTSGVCTDSGTAPGRAALCDGESIEPIVEQLQ